MAFMYKKICNIARRVAQSNPVYVSMLHFPMEHTGEMMERAASTSGNNKKSLRKAAKLSKIYTKHSVRATPITLWSNAGVQSRLLLS